MINIEIAYNLRFERGLKLPYPANYENTHLRVIAQRQFELYQELEQLDQELNLLYLEDLKGEKNDKVESDCGGS